MVELPALTSSAVRSIWARSPVRLCGSNSVTRRTGLSSRTSASTTCPQSSLADRSNSTALARDQSHERGQDEQADCGRDQQAADDGHGERTLNLCPGAEPEGQGGQAGDG